MRRVKVFISKERNLAFFFSLAVIAGPAITVLFAFDLSQYTDCYTYLNLAQFNFDENPVRRYRLIVPMMAALLNSIGFPLFNKLAPSYFTGEFSLPFSFFLVNITIMSIFGSLVYLFCRAYGAAAFPAVLGTLATLTSRYTAYLAGLPFVDSLFCVIVVLTLLGIKTQSRRMLVVCIFLGPLVKENFIFMAPLIFFYSHLRKGRLIVLFVLSGIICGLFRYMYDLYFPPTGVNWVTADVTHLPNVFKFLPLLLSFEGLYKIFINTGVWIAVPLVCALLSSGVRNVLRNKWHACLTWFIVIVIFQMLLSGSMDRMFYLAMPIISMLVAICINEIHLNFNLLATKNINTGTEI